MGLDMYAVRKIQAILPPDQLVKERSSAKVKSGKKSESGAGISLEESVMYWRKANHIHAWFVDNIQDGNDNCKEYLVSWNELRCLLVLCDKVIKASELVDGAVYQSTVYTRENPDGLVQRAPGKVIKDPSVAQKLLPTRSGFFFGHVEYDEGYLDDVKATRKWAFEMLRDHKDGLPGQIYYQSSW